MDGGDFINAVRWPTCRVLAFSQAILLLSAPTRYPACCADNSSFCLLSLPVCHQQVPCPSDLRQMAKKKDFLSREKRARARPLSPGLGSKIPILSNLS